MSKKQFITVLGIGAAGTAVFLSYLRWLRPWQLRWGATDEEVVRPMPGDEIVSQPIFNATRAVTINAPPEAIWPWILQIGIKRAGWYSYDLIDNLGKPSAREILPEFQNIRIGDIIPMSPDGKQGLYVKEFMPNNWMHWGDKEGRVSWVWGLYPSNDSQTRLITRVRMRYNWLSPAILFDLMLDVGDIVMMRKCMLGIKERAEAMA